MSEKKPHCNNWQSPFVLNLNSFKERCTWKLGCCFKNSFCRKFSQLHQHNLFQNAIGLRHYRPLDKRCFSLVFETCILLTDFSYNSVFELKLNYKNVKKVNISQIDFIVYRKRWRNSFSDCQVYAFSNPVGSDHRIVTATV